MENPAFTANDEIIIHHIEYGPYEREIKAPDDQESVSNNMTMGYLRSSSSSSSNASSGKQLVKSPFNHYPSPKSHAAAIKGRLERSYNHKDEKTPHPKSKKEIALSISSSPDVHKMLPPKFYIGSPTSSLSGCSTGYNSPERLSPSLERSSKSENERLKSHYLKPPDHHLMPPDLHATQAEFNHQLHPGMLSVPDKDSKISSIYDAYWHIPRATLWCTHTNSFGADEKCTKCQLKEETISNCSSVNPPPTFTAMDNYQPIRRKKKKCSCGAVFLATTAFSTFVLILIAAFILYIEMVLKRTDYVPDPM